MTTAILTLGPKEQPNNKIWVRVIDKWPAPPVDFFLVTDVNDRIYRAHVSQLSNFQKVDES